MRRHDFEHTMLQEVEKHPGVIISFEHRGKHKAALVTANNATVKIFYPLTPSDTKRGGLNNRQDVRRALRQLGVTK